MSLETSKDQGYSNFEKNKREDRPEKDLDSKQEDKEQAGDVLRLIEALDTAFEEKTEVQEGLIEDAALALREGKLTPEQRVQVIDLLKVVKLETQKMKEDEGSKETIERILQERYRLSIEDFLGAYKPMKLEYLTAGIAVGAELGIWALSKATGAEPSDLSLKEKLAIRWRVGGDVFKLIGKLAKFLPEAQVAAIPLSVTGDVFGRMGTELDKVNQNEEATSYDVTKAVTLAALPRNEQGNVDMERTQELLRVVGGAIEADPDSDQNSYLKEAAVYFQEHPDQVIDSLQRLDAAVQQPPQIEQQAS